ncbi:PREDICTED: anaphase-promoting complex subunit 13 isoform X2 [Papilio polytes]|uniref:anaphase-promoting complex subunit 13 isoform X2 n=1 Tax=Papilio polytes TaxID=76194 RepID=UPI00067603AE|nr:PREDICTED: anaphase-promoting complex subunit 13 isoform X2 [Papilio polytes]
MLNTTQFYRIQQFLKAINSMDSKYRRVGRLIDIVDEEWRMEQLPHMDIRVPVEELPDPEADSVDSHLTLKEQAMRWQENFPESASRTN